jgi:hypothetical protein
MAAAGRRISRSKAPAEFSSGTGILTRRREGKTVYYRADPQRATGALAELQSYLAACCPPPVTGTNAEPRTPVFRAPEG